jgi:predicted  nucleic acid-binding Zn-ribbon protein
MSDTWNLKRGGHMLLDKLWVRLKGEFLNIKEDLTDRDLTGDARSLLEKLEERIGFEKYDTQDKDLESRVNAVRDKMESPSDLEDLMNRKGSDRDLEEIRHSLDKLESKRKEKQRAEEKGPNPRVLG